jgi:hypothetical protein
MKSDLNGLIVAIFIRMLQDWKQGSDRVGISEFMGSDDFAEMARAVGLNPVVVRTKVETGQFDLSKLHSLYRRKDIRR